MLHSPKASADQTITRYALPHLVTFVTDTGPEDPERARGLIASTLTTFIGTLPEDRRAPGMALVMPTLLRRAEQEGADMYGETGTRLLELAGVDQGVFRATVGALSAEQRRCMEEVLRAGQGAKREEIEDGREEPTIKLSMNFG